MSVYVMFRSARPISRPGAVIPRRKLPSATCQHVTFSEEHASSQLVVEPNRHFCIKNPNRSDFIGHDFSKAPQSKPSQYKNTCNFYTIPLENKKVPYTCLSNGKPAAGLPIGLLLHHGERLQPMKLHPNISFCTSDKSKHSSPKDDSETPKDVLVEVENFLIHSVPKWIKRPSLTHFNQYYSPNIVFVNNYWDTQEVFEGLSQYKMQMSKYRLLGFVRYPSITLRILKSVIDASDSTVRVRWRLVCHSVTGTILSQQPDWHDGFSVFAVDQNGQIAQHVLDKMMPDEEYVEAKARFKLNPFAQAQPS